MTQFSWSFALTCGFLLSSLGLNLHAVEEAPVEQDKLAPTPAKEALSQERESDETTGEKSETVEKQDDSDTEAPLDSRFRLNQYVFDTSGVLSELDIEKVRRAVMQFTQESGFPMAVVVLNTFEESGVKSGNPKSIAKMYLEQFVEGRRDEGGRKGWLIFISVTEGAIWIQKGKDWTEEVTVPIQHVIERTIIPHLKLDPSAESSQKRNYSRAIIAGINEMLKILYRHQIASTPAISPSLDQFAAKSWLWILLGLHVLGLVYILCTKESEGWYLAGILFGLPILLAMLVFILQGEESSEEASQQKRFWIFGQGDDGSKEHACTWGYW